MIGAPESDRNAEIVCPICHKEKIISVPAQVFIQRRSGIIKVQIHEGSVCAHDFIAYVDRQGVTRGYELIDFKESVNESPKVETVESFEVHCPLCHNKIVIRKKFDMPEGEEVVEVPISKMLPGSCGHEFSVFLNAKNKVIGYSPVKNYDSNNDLRDIFSKI